MTDEVAVVALSEPASFFEQFTTLRMVGGGALYFQPGPCEVQVQLPAGALSLEALALLTGDFRCDPGAAVLCWLADELTRVAATEETVRRVRTWRRPR